jgi:PAS domain S-box-containing protein
MANRADQILLLVFVIVSFGVALLAHSQRGALARAVDAEGAERQERRRFETTLASIGDAVLATDAAGRVSYLNPVAEQLTGWTSADAAGRPLEEVFPIVNEHSRHALENPASRALREGRIVGLANHSVLLSRDGREVFIDDSAAPIRGKDGATEGAVLVFRDIGERRRMERELRESEQRFRKLANSAPVLVWVSGPDKKCTWFNQPWLEFTGRTMEQEIGDGWAEGVHQDDLDRCVATYVTSFDRREPFTMEYRRRRHDEEYRWILDRGIPLEQADGGFLGYIGSCADITDLKRAQDQAVERAQELQTLLDILPVGVWMGDAWCERITGNRTAYQMIGLPPGENVSLSAPEIRAGKKAAYQARSGGREVPVEDLPMQRVARTGQPISGEEVEAVLDDGRVITFLCNVAPLLDAQGNVRGVVGAYADISARKAAERALRNSETLFRSIADTAPVMLWITDPAGAGTFLSRGWLEFTGQAEQEALGFGWLEAVHPEDREKSSRIFMDANRKCEPFTVDYRLRRADGEYRWAIDSGRPRFDGAGNFLGYIGAVIDITERKQAEQTIEESEIALRKERERLRAALAAGRIGAFERTSDSPVIWWSPEIYGIMGVSPGDFTPTDETILQLVHPEDREALVRGFRESVEAHKPYIHEVRIVRPDGEIRWVGTWAQSEYDDAGRLQRYFGVSMDITERKMAGEQLRLRAEEIQALLDATPAFVWFAGDAGCRSITGNRTANELFGVPPETNVSQSSDNGTAIAVKHFAPDGHEMTTEELPMQRAAASGTPVRNAEFELAFNGGRRVHVVGNAAPLFDTAGKVRGCVAVFLDITERRKAEEALRLSEERLAMVMKHLPVGVGVVDARGHVLIANPAWKKFLRGDIPSVDPVEGRRWRAIGPDGRSLPPSEYPGRRALRGEEVLPGIDFLRRDDDGVERWTRTGAVPFRDRTGQIVGALVILQDIDRERRAEAQRGELAAKERALEAEKALRETEAELARVARALSVGELATSIAHEVNQPLAGVVTNAEAALRWLAGETPDIQEARESLALIVRDGNRASGVIKRIREFLKKEGQQTAQINLNDVVREAVELARAELLKRGVALRVELTDVPPVRGDWVQLQQVMLNLIMNGAEAMTSQAEPKELRLFSEKSSDGSVTIAVRDSGAGVSDEDMPRIFDAFFTTKPTGMGMGLSISRSIVEAHGGRIWVERNDGSGLTVRFALPAENGGDGSNAGSSAL